LIEMLTVHVFPSGTVALNISSPCGVVSITSFLPPGMTIFPDPAYPLQAGTD